MRSVRTGRGHFKEMGRFQKSKHARRHARSVEARRCRCRCWCTPGSEARLRAPGARAALLAPPSPRFRFRSAVQRQGPKSSRDRLHGVRAQRRSNGMRAHAHRTERTTRATHTRLVNVNVKRSTGPHHQMNHHNHHQPPLPFNFKRPCRGAASRRPTAASAASARAARPVLHFCVRVGRRRGVIVGGGGGVGGR